MSPYDILVLAPFAVFGLMIVLLWDSLGRALREQRVKNDVLRAEVERLRELLLNAGWPREADGIAELAQQAERAAVVAWLRGQKETAMRVGVALVQSGASALRQFEVEVRESTFSEAADVIERGEHRKGDE